MNPPVAIVLAAGKSTRMKSSLPKVLHEVCGRPMIEYVLDAVRAAGVQRIVVVIGHQADRVRGELSGHDDVDFALQSEQLGTGHAVMMCEAALADHDGKALILAGDTPLLRGESLAELLGVLDSEEAACVIGTAVTEQNEGLGRIVRDGQGEFVRIVEQKDAAPEEAAIEEINTGCFAFDSKLLFQSLQQIRPNNVQGEYYLTDCPAVLLAEGRRVVASPSLNIEEAMGVNTRVQLAEVSRVIQQRTQKTLMLAGVSIIAPEQTVIDPQAKIGVETVIHPFSVIRGAVEIGEGCQIGPHAVVQGPVRLPAGSVVGPFSVMGAG